MRFTKVAFAASAMFAALVVPLQLAAQVVDGSGTTNVVPRWIDSNTLGNSNISDTGGVVAVTGTIGTAATNGGMPRPLSWLQVARRRSGSFPTQEQAAAFS